MKPTQLIGAAILLVAILAVVAVVALRGGENGGADAPDPITVRGYLGGEKSGLMDDPAIAELLRDKYGITVDDTRAGSIEMVRDLPLADDVDFLWPSNQVALALYRERQGQLVASDNIFNSPIVLYSWARTTDALIAAGIAAAEADGTYGVDLAKLAAAVVEGQSWADLGLPELHGRIVIHTTDPTVSNSGNMFAGLLANVLNGGDVVNGGSVGAVLPTLTTLYDRLGFMEQSSGVLFQQFLTTGMGAKPIIAGYESQLVEFSLQNEAQRQTIKDQVRILYPRPTVWSSHPLIARTANGVRLLEALKDPELQRLAWETHGFRSGLVGIANDPAVLQLAGIPAQISSVIDMPDPGVMDTIIQTLSAAVLPEPSASQPAA